MNQTITYALTPIGIVQSPLTQREDAPNQGYQGAPDAWLVMSQAVAEGLEGIEVGQRMLVMTWLHQSRRDVLQVHPESDESNPLTGVFATRSPNRPNPLGVHPVTVREVAGNRLKVGPIEAIDGTPVIDIKPMIAHDV